MVRTRFAPSPTGYLHIGGVRTALFNWLFSRQHGGQFLLRIDDTDQQRNVDAALAPILHGFRWLGIDWDEGPEVGGPHAPYFQSQRSHRYQAAAHEAARRRARLSRLRHDRGDRSRADAAEAEKRPFLYSRHWMAETDAQAKPFEAEGRQGVVRLKMPREGTLVDSRPRPRRRRVRLGPRAGPRHPAGRRHLPVPPGERRRRFRLRDHARHPRRGASLEHAAADLHRPVARLPAAGVRPPAVRRRAGQQEQAQQAEDSQVSEEPRLHAGLRARPRRSRKHSA